MIVLISMCVMDWIFYISNVALYEYNLRKKKEEREDVY